MDRRILVLGIMSLAVPYGSSMALLGVSHASHSLKESPDCKISLNPGKGQESTMDLEAYLPYVVAGQISSGAHPEAIKAQAVLARTYICRQMEEAGMEEPLESVLWMEKYGKRDTAPEGYRQFETAVRETRGITLTWEGRLIDPLFTHTTAGFTRTGDEAHPYLRSVACSHDSEAEDFIRETSMKTKEAAERISSLLLPGGGFPHIPSGAFPKQVQIVSRDEAGYIKQIQIAGFLFDGEEVRLALGLPSSCFEMKTEGDRICFITRGKGHGWGLSQTQAMAMAEEGWTAEAILEYFYTGISLSSE